MVPFPAVCGGVGVAEVSTGPLLGGAGRPSVQGHTGEHCAALRSKGSEYIWHHGRISETVLSEKYVHSHNTIFIN